MENHCPLHHGRSNPCGNSECLKGINYLPTSTGAKHEPSSFPGGQSDFLRVTWEVLLESREQIPGPKVSAVLLPSPCIHPDLPLGQPQPHGPYRAPVTSERPSTGERRLGACSPPDVGFWVPTASQAPLQRQRKTSTGTEKIFPLSKERVGAALCHLLHQFSHTKD